MDEKCETLSIYLYLTNLDKLNNDLLILLICIDVEKMSICTTTKILKKIKVSFDPNNL